MKKATIRFSILIAVATVFACSTGSKEEKSEKTNEESVSAKTDADQAEESKSSISITAVESPKFENSSLQMLKPMENKSNIDGKGVKFAYNVKNYELGAQTSDAETKNCANSAKGQHIHLILNNGPYSAHYEPEFTKDLEDGHYVALSFLSRSYHESVKTFGASNVRQFTVGRAPKDEEVADLSDPHMFYSRPKGTYKGNDAKKVLLDFYLLNTELSENGNKVRATINGQEFMIDKWQPYFIEGQEMGEMTIKLELLDAKGELIPSPFNPVERTVTLEAGNPS